VCFPESCVYREKTLRFDGPYFKEIQKECKKNKIWCIISEDVKIKKRIYNLAILINREGKLVGHYKKINPWDEDRITPGKKIRIFKTDFGKIGIIICWDLAFPELFNKMKKSGAEIVFCPAQWAYEKRAHKSEHKKREIDILKSLLLSRAFENGYFIALCNPVRAYEPEQVSYSAIVSPHKILKEISHKEGLIVSKINLKEIDRYHKIYPR
jgi:predicted amidohydrolase